MHRNAKLHPGRSPGKPVPWEQPGSSSSMFGCCHGYRGPFSCLFLGHRLSNQRPALPTDASNWFYNEGLVVKATIREFTGAYDNANLVHTDDGQGQGY